jgi:hypothetical protein
VPSSFRPTGEILASIMRKRLGLEASLSQTLQILSVTLFERTPILCALQTIDGEANFAENVNQPSSQPVLP